jgi:hypothetical protein
LKENKSFENLAKPTFYYKTIIQLLEANPAKVAKQLDSGQKHYQHILVTFVGLILTAQMLFLLVPFSFLNIKPY